MQAAHATALAIGDLEFWVSRSFDLMRRIEQQFGPLHALDRKLRVFGFTGADLAKLYGLALADCPDRPPATEIEAHIHQAGIAACSTDLAVLVLQLFAGHKQCVAWLEAEMKAAAETAREFEGQNPPMPS